MEMVVGLPGWIIADKQPEYNDICPGSIINLPFEYYMQSYNIINSSNPSIEHISDNTYKVIGKVNKCVVKIPKTNWPLSKTSYFAVADFGYINAFNLSYRHDTPVEDDFFSAKVLIHVGHKKKYYSSEIDPLLFTYNCKINKIILNKEEVEKVTLPNNFDYYLHLELR